MMVLLSNGMDHSGSFGNALLYSFSEFVTLTVSMYMDYDGNDNCPMVLGKEEFHRR
jgi:hypothetical protein